MNFWHRGFTCLLLPLLAGAAPEIVHAGLPTCPFRVPPPGWGFTTSCSFPMPAYDQTNPNFAAYLTPATFVNEVNPLRTATITAFEIASNVVTFHANNAFTAGETVNVTGLSSTVGARFNYVAFTIQNATSSTFTILSDQANVPLTSDSGLAAAGETPQASILVCNPPSVCGNPFDTSWLPAGPIPGDPYATNAWWISATCCPTAEAMALMAAIASKSPGTTFGGWTTGFYAGVAPAATTGLTHQSGPIFPWVANARTNMQLADVQRVIDLALAQGTNPDAGGGVNYITTSAVLNSFTPPATGGFAATSSISNGTFISDMATGNVIVIAVHPYQAHVAATAGGSAITFTRRSGGHCVAVAGFVSTVFREPTALGGTVKSQAIEVLNPVYGVEQWINIFQLANGTSTIGGRSVTVSLPSSLGVSVGVWPDHTTTATGQSTTPTNSVSDIADGDVLSFIDTYLTLNVP